MEIDEEKEKNLLKSTCPIDSQAESRSHLLFFLFARGALFCPCNCFSM